MTFTIATCLLATALFLAFLLSLALHPGAIKRITGWAMLYSATAGLLFYGLGYGTAAHTPTEMLVAALQAGNATLWLFGGRESFAALKSSAPWFADTPAFHLLYWLAYLLAVYVTASAVLNTLGQRLLRALRQRLLPVWRVCLFYGAEDETLDLAGSLAGGEQRLRPLFVWGEGSALSARADQLGGVVWPEESVDEGGLWLRRLGLRPGNGKRLEIVCLHPDDGKNRRFLNKVAAGIQAQSLSAAQVHIASLGVWEAYVPEAHVLAGGEVLPVDAYTRGELAARRLIDAAPPWRLLDFDGKGCAGGDLTALIVGFGSVGQSLLRYLIQNAQFTGSRFSAVVVDKSAVGGAFRMLYSDLLARYHVSFVQADADSPDFVEEVERLLPELRLAAVCTGNDKRNREVMGQLRSLRERRGDALPARWTLARLGAKGITLWEDGEKYLPVMTLEELITGQLDRRAMAVNAAYLKRTAESLYPDDEAARQQYYRDGWYRADLTSRLSSRASAAFLPAMYGSVGLDAAQSDAPARFREKLSDAETLEALSQTEHLRWNAFQSSMGVRQMGAAEFRRRVEACLAAIREPLAELEHLTGAEALDRAGQLERQIRSAAARVRRDKGLHVCLATWEELGPLWEIYRPLDEALNRTAFLAAKLRHDATGEGGEPVLPESHDFRQLDRDMVLNLAELGGVS